MSSGVGLSLWHEAQPQVGALQQCSDGSTGVAWQWVMPQGGVVGPGKGLNVSTANTFNVLCLGENFLGFSFISLPGF